MASRKAELEAERTEVARIIRESLARLAGIDAELEALSSPESPANGLAAAPRTEAITEVLRRSSGTLSPKQIQAALESEGRDDSLRAITATLDYLLRTTATVVRLGRGRYQLIQ